MTADPQPNTGVDEARRAWVDRVLGVTLPSAIGAARAAQARSEIAKGLGPMTMAFRKSRLSWSQARNTARAAVLSLQQRLREVLRNEPDFAALDREISKFDGIMAGLDDRLETTLDTALNGADEAQMKQLKQQAQQQIGEYIQFIEGHPFLRKIDGNAFMPIQVFSVLSTELGNLAKALGA
jgi:hypothetical protein